MEYFRLSASQGDEEAKKYYEQLRLDNASNVNLKIKK